MKKKVKVLISGQVQGVCFRAYAERKALELGVNGWIRNLYSGQVEGVFEGEEVIVKEMINWCYQGSPYAKVTKVEVTDLPFLDEFKFFTITY